MRIVLISVENATVFSSNSSDYRGYEARFARGLLQAMEKRNKIRKSIEVCFEASHSHVSGIGV